MRIIVLCLSPGRGGLELYALREIEYLRSCGIDCTAVVAANGMLEEKLTEAGVAPLVLHSGINSFPLFRAKKLAEIIQQEKADILHFHWSKDLNLAALAKALAARPLKLVYSRHMGITRSKRDIFHAWFYRRLDKFLVTTKVMLQQAKKNLPVAQERIELLYLGVEAPQHKAARCRHFFADAGFARRKLNIALFGRIEEGKGQHLMLDALAMLLQEGREISVTIIGHVMDEAYFNRLKNKAREYGLQNHLRFEGFVREPLEVMGCFDLIVLTTYCETFGLVLVEAMRAGVAVVGTDAGGVPEIIEHGKSGMLVEPGNAGALAKVVGQLYEDEALLKKLAAQGKQKADSLFSETTHFARLKQIFGTLLNG